MSECERIEPLLEAWLDGEVSDADDALVRRHVSGCSRCAEAQRRFERIGAALSRVLVADAPALEFRPFWKELERRIQEPTPWHRQFLERARAWCAAPRAAWAIPAAIAILIGLISYDFYYPFGKPRNNLATVESIDAYGRSVALLREDESKTTVIWLYQTPEGDDEAADETAQPGPAF
jgi:hypothetical protein